MLDDGDFGGDLGGQELLKGLLVWTSLYSHKIFRFQKFNDIVFYILFLTLRNTTKMSDLKIRQIDVFQVDLPYSGGVYYLSGGRAITRFDATFVRVITDHRIEGWGESTPFDNYIASHAGGIRAAIAEIAPKLIGLDPRRVDRVNDAMDAALLGSESAKSAIDIACWDIFGKSVGLPVCELLGGRTSKKLPVLESIPVSQMQMVLASLLPSPEQLDTLDSRLKLEGTR